MLSQESMALLPPANHSCQGVASRKQRYLPSKIRCRGQSLEKRAVENPVFPTLMAVFYLTIIQSPTPVFLLATQSMKSLSPNKSSRQSSANTQLSVENLEPRMMLSTVEIFAAGTSGFEQFELQINGAAVQTFTAGSGIESRNFQSFVFETPETITAGDVSIEFLNCLLYTSPSPRDGLLSRMPSSA